MIILEIIQGEAKSLDQRFILPFWGYELMERLFIFNIIRSK